MRDTADKLTDVTLTGATSVTVDITTGVKDLTSITLDSEVTHVDFNDVQDVLVNIADISGKTLDLGDTNKGNYIVVGKAEDFLNVAVGDNNDFKAMYGSAATAIRITDWKPDSQDLDTIGLTTAVKSKLTDLKISNTDLKVELVLSADTTITSAYAEKLNTIDKIILEGSDTDLIINADAFKPGNKGADQASTLAKLSEIVGNGSDSDLTIKDVGETNDGSKIDLNQITSTSDLKSITVQGDTGINIIQLSEHLSTNGITTVDLGDEGSSEVTDELIFNVSNSTLANGSVLNGYNTVNNFDVAKDLFGVFYNSVDGSGNAVSEASFNQEVMLSDRRGPANLDNDLTFIESDISRFTQQTTDLTDETTVKGLIASGIVKVEDAADRVTTLSYGTDSDTRTVDGFLTAAAMGTTTADDLATSDNFSVVSIAKIVGTGYKTLDTVVNGAFVKDEDLS